MKKIYEERPEIIVRLWNSDDVVTASYGDDNVGFWSENWFGNTNGGGTNGGDIDG
jgi:hypothetical protein